MTASTDRAAAGHSIPVPAFPPLDADEEAGEAIESALARHPGWADLRCRAGLLRLTRGDLEGAIGDLGAALSANPRYAWARLNLAAALALAGEAARAQDLLADAADPAPGARALTGSWIAVFEGRVEAAETGLWRLPARLHGRGEVRFLRSTVRALRDGRSAIEPPWRRPDGRSFAGSALPMLLPGLHELWLFVSRHQMGRRRPDRARAAAGIAALFWSDPAVLLNHEGGLAALAGDEERAVRWHAAAFDAAPDDPRAAAELARFAGRAGDPVRARALLKAALRRAPGYADLHRQLGSLEASLGDDEAALRSFRRALAINPLYRSARREEAAALARLGRWSEAAEILRRLPSAIPRPTAPDAAPTAGGGSGGPAGRAAGPYRQEVFRAG